MTVAMFVSWFCYNIVEAGKAAAAAASVQQDLVPSRLDLRIGKILSVEKVIRKA